MQTSLLDFYSYTRFYQLQNDLEGKTNNVSISNPKGKEIYSYLEDIIKKSEEKNLYEKYAISINLIMNKDQMELNKDLSEEMYMSLINWITIEKNNLEKNLLLNKNLNIYININIFIGLLINIINLLETSNVTINYLIKNKFIQKLNSIYTFLKSYLIPNFININPTYKDISLKFITKKFEKILSKWKKQKDCYELSQKIYDFFGKKKSSFLGKKKLRDNSSDEEFNNSTMESVETFAKDKNDKKVKFDMEQNEIYYYNQNEKISKTD